MTLAKRNRIVNNIIDTSLFGGKMKPTQLAGINAILDEWIRAKLKDERWLVYILATTFHETDRTMQAIEEYGKGKGKKYGKKVKYDGTPYTFPNKIYYGMGHPQLTWYDNYEKFGKLLNLPLLEQPELMLDNHISARVMILGMSKGLFTGVGLSRYFNDTKDDPINARRVVNVLDKASLIAGYYNDILKAIKEAS